MSAQRSASIPRSGLPEHFRIGEEELPRGLAALADPQQKPPPRFRDGGIVLVDIGHDDVPQVVPVHVAGDRHHLDANHLVFVLKFLLADVEERAEPPAIVLHLTRSLRCQRVEHRVAPALFPSARRENFEGLRGPAVGLEIGRAFHVVTDEAQLRLLAGRHSEPHARRGARSLRIHHSGIGRRELVDRDETRGKANRRHVAITLLPGAEENGILFRDVPEMRSQQVPVLQLFRLRISRGLQGGTVFIPQESREVAPVFLERGRVLLPAHAPASQGHFAQGVLRRPSEEKRVGHTLDRRLIDSIEAGAPQKSLIQGLGEHLARLQLFLHHRAGVSEIESVKGAALGSRVGRGLRLEPFGDPRPVARVQFAQRDRDLPPVLTLEGNRLAVTRHELRQETLVPVRTPPRPRFRNGGKSGQQQEEEETHE